MKAYAITSFSNCAFPQLLKYNLQVQFQIKE